jgi:4-amino-4-deoxy-L-arabinose transferase-like glycosyltransferase
VAGNGYTLDSKPTAEREPVYPFFLASIYYLFGHNLFVVRFIQVIIGTLTCFLVFRTGQLVFSQDKGFWSLLIIATYPHFIYFNSQVLSETVFIFLVILSGFLLISASKEEGICRAQSRFFFAGVTLGLAILCKSSALLLPVFSLIGLFLVFKKDYKKILKICGLFYLGVVLTLLPWLARNFFIYHKIVFREGAGGFTQIWLGNNPAIGNFASEQEEIGRILNKIKEMPVDEQDRYAFRQVFNFISKHPVLFLRNWAIKFLRLWQPFPHQTETLEEVTGLKSSLIKWFSILSDCWLIPLGFLGLIMSLKDWKKFIWIYIILFSFILTYTIVYPMQRFRLPLMPYLIIGTEVILFKYSRVKNYFTGYLYSNKESFH